MREMVQIERPAITEEKFREVYGYQTEVKVPIKQRVKSRIRGVTREDVKNRLKTTFCAFAISVRGYTARTFLSDLIAGLTVAFIRLPQGLAYGALANVPPIHGLYTELFSCVLYSLFGTSRHNSVGTFAVISLMTGAVVDEYVTPDQCQNGTTRDDEFDIEPLPNYDVACVNQLKSEFVYSVTMLVGLMQIIFGLCQFGRLSILLPRHVVQAFTTAAAFYVLTSQVRVMLGLTRIHVPRNMEIGGLFSTWYHIFAKIKHSKVSSIVVSIICIAVLTPLKYLSRTYKAKLRNFPLPGELLLVISFTLICSFYPSWGKLGELETVGEIPQGIPVPVLPNVKTWSKIAGDVFPIAIISYTTTLSIGKLFAYKHKYPLDAMQEAFAIGIANLCGSFFRTIPACASLSRSALQDSAGGVTQVVSFISSIIVIISLLFVGPYFAVIPKALLAALIAVNLRGMFMQFHELKPLWNYSKIDFLVWVCGFLSVIVFGIDIGLGIAVMILILSIVYRKSQQGSMAMGQIPKSEIFRSPAYYTGVNVNEYKIFRFTGAIDFASAETMMDNLPRCDTIIIDCASVPYIDCIGRNALNQAFLHYDAVALCNVTEDCHTCLDLGEILDMDNVQLYPTVLDAISMLNSPDTTASTTSSGISNSSFSEK